MDCYFVEWSVISGKNILLQKHFWIACSIALVQHFVKVDCEASVHQIQWTINMWPFTLHGSCNYTMRLFLSLECSLNAAFCNVLMWIYKLQILMSKFFYLEEWVDFFYFSWLYYILVHFAKASCDTVPRALHWTIMFSSQGQINQKSL